MDDDFRTILGYELSKLRKETNTPLQALSFLSGLDEEDIIRMEQNLSDYSIDNWNDVLSAMGCRLGIVNKVDKKVPDYLQRNRISQRVVMIIGNGIVVVLEGMIVAIQVIRLQYYEFFSKFFNETGREFKPFKFENK